MYTERPSVRRDHTKDNSSLSEDPDNDYVLLTIIDDEPVAISTPAPARLRLDPGWIAETVIAIVVWLAIAIAAPILITQAGWSPWWYIATGLGGLTVAASLWDAADALLLVHRHNKYAEAGEGSTA